MKCCINCFKDPHIRDTIKKFGTIGDCDFCFTNNIQTYDISIPNNLISNMILGLVQSYIPSSLDYAKPLKIALQDDWEIFTGDSESIQNLVIELCSFEIDKNNEIFTNTVIIQQANDDAFLKRYGVVKNLSWNQFSKSIKHNNRFHNDMFNPDILASFLSMATYKHSEGEKLFRARISNNRTGFKPNEMFAPPIGLRRAGRVNPEGIGVLYLASNWTTALNEVRANVYDFVSVGEFVAKKNLKIVDLSALSNISPFLYEEDFGRFFVNRNVFKEMALEIAKPLRRNDSILEYLPTQYISEFVKSQGYDGVAYKSTLYNGGYNIAVYDETLFDCINVTTVEITQIEYKFNKE